MTFMSMKARTFIAVTVLVGFAVLIHGLSQWQTSDMTRYVCYLLLALLASGLKVTLPGITGTMSVIFLFVLVGIMELSLPETLLAGCAGTLIQCYWKAKERPKLVQVLFNVANMAIAMVASNAVYHSAVSNRMLHQNVLLLLVATAITFFLSNTVPVATVIGLTERKPVSRIWSECYFWSFTYYLAGAAIADLLSLVNRFIGWETSLVLLPVIYSIYRSYRLYLGRLEGEKNHAEQMAALHLRTIEALALAIEAKDQNTCAHLSRVRVYAVELGKELGISDSELEALRAASMLHDIGKLAVPEHIISKPGRLTPEEFEKMKIHPTVGAEILERVQFPYPVVPIVRAHHEKWDGTGYPLGLKQEEIPLSARILAAVDCLDALASDRQYRGALPLDQAMEVVSALSGKSFDPKVVKVLQKRYVQLEEMVRTNPMEHSRLSTSLRIKNGEAPDAGFAHDPLDGNSDSIDFLKSIAAARQEVQMLFELTQSLGNSLSLDETLSVLAVRLKHLIPYDSIVIYSLKNDTLIPEHVSGDNFRHFSSMRLPLGKGVSGWVAENCKPLLNGNPSVDPEGLNDLSNVNALQSALAVPLEGINGLVGVLTLYRTERDAFTKDHLRILLAISSKIALSVENALKYSIAESSATTDYLTGLPNARSLFLQLDSELARCKRSKNPLAVVVCDLDGFKQINDKFGHLLGNRVLSNFAMKLKSSSREYDYVARMGGDEFVLLLPGLKPEAFRDKAQQLRHLAQEAGREICGVDWLSLSVGHSFSQADGVDAEQLLADADRRMFEEKKQHHNELYTKASLTLPEYHTARIN